MLPLCGPKQRAQYNAAKHKETVSKNETGYDMPKMSPKFSFRQLEKFRKTD